MLEISAGSASSLDLFAESTMDRWRGKVAVVTGASAGIGAAICQKLVEEGMIVVGLARREEKVQQQAKALQGQKGKLHALKADMTVESDILNAFKWTTDNLGPVHVLVNNAGVLLDTTLIDGDTAKWKAVLDTNVLGLSIATREAIRIMRKNGIDGHIIHINSIAGHYPMYVPGMNIYGASKYAVTNLTDSLRRELVLFKLNIKVTSISPGIVETDILQNIGVGVQEVVDMIGTAPKLQSEDIANSVLYVLGTPPHVQVHEIIIKPTGEEH